MTATWVVEAVDVFKEGDFDVVAGLPATAPDQFGLEGFELWPKVDGAVKSRFILGAGPSIFGHDYIARQKDR